MRKRAPLLLVVAVVAIGFVVLLSGPPGTGRGGAPARPDDSGAAPEPGTPAPVFSPEASTVPVSAEPAEAEPAPGTEPGEPGKEPTVDQLVRAALNLVGGLFREAGDVEGFLEGSGSGPWKLVSLSPEAKARLLQLVASDSPDARFQAAMALCVTALDPADLALLRSRMDAELAGMNDEKTKNTALALAFALERNGDRHGIARLGDALRSGVGSDIPHFRNGAVLVIALTDDTESSPLLRELLATDPDRIVRKHAAIGLGRFGGEENRASLADAIVREQDLEVRAWSALAAGRAAPKGGDDGTLARALSEDPAGEVRGAAAFALGKAGGPGTVDTLIDTWYAEDHGLARIGAIAGVARRGGGERAREFLGGEAASWLADAVVTSGSSVERYYAARVLGSVPDSEARRPALERAAASDRSGWVRRQAIDSVVKAYGKSALPFLRERATNDPDAGLKKHIEREIRRLDR